MKPEYAPWIAAAVSIGLTTLMLWFLRFPLPFQGFTALASGMLAALVCWAMLLAMPARWLHSEEALIAHAFQARHGVSAIGADNALGAVQQAHARAMTLRRVAGDFVPALRRQAEAVADRLDATARQLFYEPRAFRDLHAPLGRAELIEEVVHEHAALRGRIKAAGEGDSVKAASRARVSKALDALDEALRSVDLDRASQLLTSIEVKSEVAETLLRPQVQTAKQMDQSETSS